MGRVCGALKNVEIGVISDPKTVFNLPLLCQEQDHDAQWELHWAKYTSGDVTVYYEWPRDAAATAPGQAD